MSPQDSRAPGKGNEVKNKTTRFLRISLILILLLCLVMFSFLGVFMNVRSLKTINEVGTLYMSGMSEQISLHFQTTVGLRLSQLEALMRTLPDDIANSGDLTGTFAELAYNAQARDFNYLAFYTSEGEFEMLMGEEVSVTDPPPFDASMKAGEKKVAVGTDGAGQKIVLLGPAVWRCGRPCRPPGSFSRPPQRRWPSWR